jgi:hypothetical protein
MRPYTCQCNVTCHVQNCVMNVKVTIKVNDRQSFGQSVLVLGTHLGPATHFSLSLKFPLDSCGFIIL